MKYLICLLLLMGCASEPPKVDHLSTQNQIRQWNSYHGRETGRIYVTDETPITRTERMKNKKKRKDRR